MVTSGLTEFAEPIAPQVRRRALFRADYEASTLRGNLGLPRPANRYTAATQPAAVAAARP